MNNKKTEKNNREHSTEIGLAFGAGLGITFGPILGIFIDNIGLGISLGLVFGAAIGYTFREGIAQLFAGLTKRTEEDESEPSQD